ncbi:hypothetical protein [Xanthomonas arboricola]|uniref:hypothetical protein n=1 Tax=Xanthomonas arboricola TaxID=56448 RepID=UPI0040409D93
MSKKFIHEHAESLRRFAEETAKRAAENPNDFFLQIAAKSQWGAAEAAHHDLLIEDAHEAGELVDLRLIGPRANGSISLDWFLKAMPPLSRSWKLAACRLRYGHDSTRQIGEDITNALNLKLAGIGYGSTRIYVTGNSAPDLTGESLLQATLSQVFSLLNSDMDEFYEAVDAVGGRSAHQLGDFMKELDNGGLAAQFTWQSPRGRLIWDGRPNEITRIRALLDTIREPERYEEFVTGRVAGITDTGKLELRTDDGKVLIRFPLNLTDIVQQLTITSLATVRVSTARYWDTVQKKDTFKRQLLGVE